MLECKKIDTTHKTLKVNVTIFNIKITEQGKKFESDEI